MIFISDAVPILMKMSHLKIVLCIVAACVCYVEGNDCRTPSGGSGTCKSIYDCAPLLELVNKPNRTPQEVELLASSKCGFVGNIPKVCCPNSCYTPEGQTGTCVSIYSCPHLAKILKPPVTQDNINYVQNSRCNGPDQYSVCCGPPRDNFVVPSGNCAATVSAFPPDPRTECCGVDSSVGNKIVGGTATRVDQYPWLALIEYTKQGENQIKLLCGGALISGRYVLTAAHCLTGQILNFGIPKNVRLAEYDTNNDGPDCAIVEANGEDCTDGVVTIPIEETKAHEDYNRGGRQGKNDIGLVRLARLAPWTDFIRPICLPTMDLTISPPINFTLYAAGWGAVSERQPSSNIKLHVDLPFVSREACQPAYRAPGRNVNLGQGQICAGGQAGKDSCKGDSGGPLMYENGRIYELIGIVSFGPKPCGLENIPGVYTKVFEYKNWIMANIRP